MGCLKARLEKAFTLIEIAIVIAVIAIIIAIVIPQFVSLISSAELSDDKITVKYINETLYTNEAVNGRPDNVLYAFEGLYNNGYKPGNFTLNNGNQLIYDADLNTMSICDSNFDIFYSEESSFTSINTAYYAVNAQSGQCVIGVDFIDCAVNAGFNQFYLYSTDSVITVESQVEIILWIYTESDDVNIIAENATVYHNKCTANCTSKSYTSLSDSSYNTAEAGSSSYSSSTETESSYDYSSTDDSSSTDSEEPHVHEFGDWEVINEATCTEEGSKWQYCSCGECNEDVLPQLGHDYAATNNVKATVDAQGYTTYTCTRCYSCYNDDFTDYRYTEQLKFEKSTDGNYYIVTGISDTSIQDIYIPSYYKGADDDEYLPVKEIAAEAFSGNSNIVNVTIGCTIETIGDYAFYMCQGLKKVNIPEGLKTFGEECFSRCIYLSEIYYEAICVASLGDNRFAQVGKNTNLTLYISNSVETIPEDLFAITDDGMEATIDTIIFDENCYAKIGRTAFFTVLNIKTIVLSSNVTVFNGYVFYTSSLTNIYYMGTENQWKDGGLSTMNFSKKANAIYFYSESKPETDTDNYWHYDADNNIEIWSTSD